MKPLTAVIDLQKDFVWGPVVDTLVLENICVIKYHPQVFKNCSGTGRYSKKVQYHPYVHTEALKQNLAVDNRDSWVPKTEGWHDTSNTYQSLEEALVGAIAFIHDGANSRAAGYFMRSIGAEA